MEGSGEDASGGTPHVVEGQGTGKGQAQVLPQVGVGVQPPALGSFLQQFVQSQDCLVITYSAVAFCKSSQDWRGENGLLVD